MFVCLALRVVLNTVTDLTFVTLLDGQLLQTENGTFHHVRYVDWSFGAQRMGRGTYLYGMAAVEVLGGWLAVRRGHPRAFALAVGSTSLLTLLTPTMLRASCPALLWTTVAARLTEAFFARNLELVWGRWVSLDSKWPAAVVYSGIIWGDILGTELTLRISDLFSTPPLYYTMGSVGLIVCAMWWAAIQKIPVIHHAPPSHPVVTAPNHGQRVGCCRVVMSLPVLALVAAVNGNFWSYLIFPTCLSDVCIEDLSPEYVSLGRLVPLLALYIFIYVSTFQEVSTKLVRKAYVCVPLAVSGGLVFLVPTLPRPPGIGLVAAVTTDGICSALAYNTCLVNVLDIAPRFAPVIVGLLAAVGAVCVPLVISTVEFLTQDHTEVSWQKVYFISGGTTFVGAFMFLAFGSVKLQNWAKEETEAQLTINQDFESLSNTKV